MLPTQRQPQREGERRGRQGGRDDARNLPQATRLDDVGPDSEAHHPETEDHERDERDGREGERDERADRSAGGLRSAGHTYTRVSCGPASSVRSYSR